MTTTTRPDWMSTEPANPVHESYIHKNSFAFANPPQILPEKILDSCIDQVCMNVTAVSEM